MMKNIGLVSISGYIKYIVDNVAILTYKDSFFAVKYVENIGWLPITGGLLNTKTKEEVESIIKLNDKVKLLAWLDSYHGTKSWTGSLKS